jgi:hypothetical protein
MKLREPVLSLQGDITQPDPGAAWAVAHLVEPRRVDQTDRHSVCESVVHVCQRTEAVRMSRDQIGKIGLDQEMSAR